MRKIMALLAALSLVAVTPVYAASTTTASGATVTTSATAIAGPGGFSNAQSFGLAETSIITSPNTTATQSGEVNRVSGVAVGNAAFSAQSFATAYSFGASSR